VIPPPHPKRPPGTNRLAARPTVAALTAGCLLSGCGYTLKSTIPSYIKTLAVPVVQNNTVEYALADEVTQALVDGFLAEPHLRIVSLRDANAVLRGTIVSYRNRVFGYTREERATEYEVVLVVQITFRDLVKNRDLWREDAFTVRTTYNVSPVGAAGEARTEADARREVIKKLADQIVSRAVQGW
jgi:outer membrane lipopolysaccharide assembly protein LptE/RlpB